MFRSVIFLLVIIATEVYGGVSEFRGFDLAGRIRGGENTTIRNYPYIVSVRVFNIHFCGGSIVSGRIIVTAAHCVYPSLPPNTYSVQYATSIIGGMSNVITAERTLCHENYNTTNYNNDICLIFLSTAIPINAGAKPIQLASEDPAAGASAVITGWGLLYEDGPKASILQYATVQIIARSVCQERYKGINRITLSMLCAGVNNGGIDACKLDSGGPLVINGQLAGITSYGNGCGKLNYPGIYTNIATLKEWIDKNMAA